MTVWAFGAVASAPEGATDSVGCYGIAEAMS